MATLSKEISLNAGAIVCRWHKRVQDRTKGAARSAFAGRRKIDRMNRSSAARAFVTVLIVLTIAVPALANRESDALRVKGAAQIFNLDRELALDTFKQAIAAD